MRLRAPQSRDLASSWCRFTALSSFVLGEAVRHFVCICARVCVFVHVSVAIRLDSSRGVSC